MIVNVKIVVASFQIIMQLKRMLEDGKKILPGCVLNVEAMTGII